MKNKKIIIGLLALIIGTIMIILYFFKKPINTSIIIENSTTITWNENGVKIGEENQDTSSTITLTNEGTYTLTGNSKDGNVVVDAKGKDIILILDNLNLTSTTTAPIYVKKAETVTIKLADNTDNYLSDNSAYKSTDNDEINATLHSKADLVIEGSGKLTINANYNNGITVKDTVTINDSNIKINSINNGIKAKDSLTVENATIEISALGNGIKSDNETDNNLGWINLINSDITVTSGQDGIEAITSITVNEGTYTITSGGGSSNASTKNDWGHWGNYKENEDEEESAKGIKVDGTLNIQNGTFIIDSSDDSIHTNDSITIKDGNFTISSGDDGIHADNTINLSGGNIKINKSYEGIEASTINIDGGTAYITASDDGINAGGGSDSSAMNRPGANMFSSDGSLINFSDGYVVIDASGDGFDSNGDINMTGGTLIVEGPTNDGNGAIDYNGTYNMNGGTLIAVGSSGMAEAPSSSSTQNIIKLSFTKESADNAIRITDEEGNVILIYTPSKQYSSLVYSSSLLIKNQSYKIELGGKTIEEGIDGICNNCTYENGKELTTLTLTKTITTYGNSGFNGGMHMPPR